MVALLGEPLLRASYENHTSLLKASKLPPLYASTYNMQITEVSEEDGESGVCLQALGDKFE